MQVEKKLFLIPATLGDTEVKKVIPEYNLLLINNLKNFVVEEVKSARRFLIRCGYNRNISDIKFYVLNEHTPEADIPFMIDASADEDLGLISEAGLPAVADPGSLLVSEAHKRDMRVIPLVGPSSLMLALMASGLNGQNFAFHGYLPVKSEARFSMIRHYEKISQQEHQSKIFIEAPYRNNQVTEAFLSALKPETRLCIAMNLSLNDEWIRTRTIREWKINPPGDLHKKPVVFIIQA